jgi:hypothetical protein
MTTTTHPSYASVRFARVHSNGVNLFKSPVKSGAFVEITIARAEDLGDRIYDDERLITVALSPAQFAELLTCMNGPATPATITRMGGKLIEPPPEPEQNPLHKMAMDRVTDIFEGRLTELTKQLSELQGLVDNGKVPVRLAEKLSDTIKNAKATARLLKLDTEYVGVQMTEAAEHLQAAVKAELYAAAEYLTGRAAEPATNLLTVDPSSDPCSRPL